MATRNPRKKTASTRKAASKKKSALKKTTKKKATNKKAAQKKTGKPASKKAANKTAPSRRSVSDLLATVAHPGRREDAQRLIKMMRRITGKSPQVWGSMIGFGSYHYKYESGREGDLFISGFAPRAQNLVVYIMQGFSASPDLMERLGKYKTGKSCLYLNRLDDVHQDVLAELIERSEKYMRAKYECK